MKHILLPLFLFAAAFGCNYAALAQSKLSEPYRISLNVDKLSPTGAPRMSEVIDSLEYIKLEYHPEYPIARFFFSERPPYITKDYIFVYCNNGLLQYTRKGKFVRIIGHKGNGPGEYIFLHGFQINEPKNLIYTLPGYKTSIDKYDYKSGKYLDKTEIAKVGDLTLETMQITPVSNDLVVRLNSPEHRWQHPVHYSFSILNLATGQVLYNRKSTLYGMKNLGLEKRLFRSALFNMYDRAWQNNQNQFSYWEALCDTAYTVGSNYSLKPRFIADYGTAKPEIKLYLNPKNTTFPDNKIVMKSLLESTRFLFFNFTYQKNYFLTAFDKSTGKHYLADKQPNDDSTVWPFYGMDNDIDGGFSVRGVTDKDKWIISYDAIEMISLLTPEHFTKMKSKVKYPERLARLQKFVASLDENDNPIIVIAHLKK